MLLAMPDATIPDGAPNLALLAGAIALFALAAGMATVGVLGGIGTLIHDGRWLALILGIAAWVAVTIFAFRTAGTYLDSLVVLNIEILDSITQDLPVLLFVAGAVAGAVGGFRLRRSWWG